MGASRDQVVGAGLRRGRPLPLQNARRQELCVVPVSQANHGGVNTSVNFWSKDLASAHPLPAVLATHYFRFRVHILA